VAAAAATLQAPAAAAVTAGELTGRRGWRLKASLVLLLLLLLLVVVIMWVGLALRPHQAAQWEFRMGQGAWQQWQQCCAAAWQLCRHSSGGNWFSSSSSWGCLLMTLLHLQLLLAATQAGSSSRWDVRNSSGSVQWMVACMVKLAAAAAAVAAAYLVLLGCQLWMDGSSSDSDGST
jgi:hypothetical protein